MVIITGKWTSEVFFRIDIASFKVLHNTQLTSVTEPLVFSENVVSMRLNNFVKQEFSSLQECLCDTTVYRTQLRAISKNGQFDSIP